MCKEDKFKNTDMSIKALQENNENREEKIRCSSTARYNLDKISKRNFLGMEYSYGRTNDQNKLNFIDIAVHWYETRNS
jgi:hypothetical protein